MYSLSYDGSTIKFLFKTSKRHFEKSKYFDYTDYQKTNLFNCLELYLIYNSRQSMVNLSVTI